MGGKLAYSRSAVVFVDDVKQEIKFDEKALEIYEKISEIFDQALEAATEFDEKKYTKENLGKVFELARVNQDEDLQHIMKNFNPNEMKHFFVDGAVIRNASREWLQNNDKSYAKTFAISKASAQPVGDKLSASRESA